MCTMSDSSFPAQFGRGANHAPDWTPQSAVSSFNFPLKYDSTLNTPVSLHEDSATVHIKRQSSMHKAWIDHQQMCYSPRDPRTPYPANSHSPMKSKGSSLSLPVSETDMGISISPYVFDSPQACPPTPYWGSFGVSAPQDSGPTSPSINSNPTPQTSSTPTFNQASSTPTYNQAPILSAPNPNQLKRNHEITPIQNQQPFQQGPVPHHNNSITHDISPTESMFSSVKHEVDSPSSDSPAKRHKSSAPQSAHPEHLALFEGSMHNMKSSRSGATLSTALLAESTEEEKLLLQLRDEHEPYLDWKQTTAKFNEMMGKHHNAPALQMRYFRLKERLRVWTDVEVNALKLSKITYDKVKWDTISQQMMKNGCTERWSPRACQIKYAELYPDEYDASPELTLTDDASISILLRTDEGPSKLKRRRNTGGGSASARSGGRGSMSAQSANGEYSGPFGGPQRSTTGDSRRRAYEQQHAWNVMPQHGAPLPSVQQH